MKNSKKQVEDAILFFANKFGQKKGYEALISSNVGLPKVVEMIAYEMYLVGYKLPSPIPIQKVDETESYWVIHRYATELRKNGFVVHE